MPTHTHSLKTVHTEPTEPTRTLDLAADGLHDRAACDGGVDVQFCPQQRRVPHANVPLLAPTAPTDAVRARHRRPPNDLLIFFPPNTQIVERLNKTTPWVPPPSMRPRLMMLPDPLLAVVLSLALTASLPLC
eukprot:283321-Rhodomonas_salina.2